jgi:soluble lytic murein transglycosylase
LRGGRWLFLVAVGSVAMAVALWFEGPAVARQVWGLVGVHQVEGHAETIRAAARESSVDPCLLAAIMYVESRGRVDAVSSAGALGLYQLMPSAAEDAARRLKLPKPTREELLADPVLNARLGANHLAWLIRADGPDLVRVLVGYNAGRTKVQRWEKAYGGFENWRRERAGKSEALVYAEQVLEFAERFRERGAIVAAAERGPGAPVPASVAPASPSATSAAPATKRR